MTGVARQGAVFVATASATQRHAIAIAIAIAIGIGTITENLLMATAPHMPTLHIGAFTDAHDLPAMAALMAASDPWLTLGRSAQSCLAVLSDACKERFAAFQGDAFAGFLILNLRGAFVGYLQTVFVAPQARDSGVGSALIQFAEARIFGAHPNVFLCVSAFNTGARRLYERLGYAQVGELTDYLTAGQSEMLLRKTRGPIGSYRRSPPADPH